MQQGSQLDYCPKGQGDKTMTGQITAIRYTPASRRDHDKRGSVQVHRQGRVYPNVHRVTPASAARLQRATQPAYYWESPRPAGTITGSLYRPLETKGARSWNPNRSGSYIWARFACA